MFYKRMSCKAKLYFLLSTGDNSNIMIWTGIMMPAAGGVTIFVRKKFIK